MDLFSSWLVFEVQNSEGHTWDGGMVQQHVGDLEGLREGGSLGEECGSTKAWCPGER